MHPTIQARHSRLLNLILMNPRSLLSSSSLLQTLFSAELLSTMFAVMFWFCSQSTEKDLSLCSICPHPTSLCGCGPVLVPSMRLWLSHGLVTLPLNRSVWRNSHWKKVSVHLSPALHDADLSTTASLIRSRWASFYSTGKLLVSILTIHHLWLSKEYTKNNLEGSTKNNSGYLHRKD